MNTSVKLLHRGRPCSQAAGSLPRMAARLDFGLTGDYGGGRVLGGVRALKLKSSERCTHGRQCQSRTINVATIVSHESESSSNGMLYPHTSQKLVPACQTIRRQPTSLRRGTSRQSPTPATTHGPSPTRIEGEWLFAADEPGGMRASDASVVNHRDASRNPRHPF